VVEPTVVIVCRERRTFWPADAIEPSCTDPTHNHSEWQLHRHRTPVLLPDGNRVVAVSFDSSDPYARETLPDFGLYLDHRWSPPWPHDHVEWSDFGVPVNSAELRTKLVQLLERSERGELVELGCLAAHGRTGTALACLAVLAGVPASDAVAWVRNSYCDEAVETPEQMSFVGGLRT
jgi:protein-tyrosine phosphatase